MISSNRSANALFSAYALAVTAFLFVAFNTPIHRNLPLRQEQSNVITVLNNENTQNDDCSSSWGKFVRQKSVLTETQLVQRPFPPPLVDTDNMNLFDGLFIDPANNFAFCAIAKNAVSQWKTVLRNVMENRTTHAFEGPDYNLAESSLAKHGVEQAKKILESRHSTVAVMVRDPLARFASAFLGKCFSNNCRNRGCIPRRNRQKGSPISFRQAVEFILSPTVNVSDIDVHWKLQSERCGISSGSLDKYFSIVGKMTKETLSRDAECIMKQAGINRFNLPASPTKDTTASFWNDGGTPKIRYRQETEEEVLRKLFTPTTARLVMKKYQQDYDKFQLPEPEWISQATGEWIDTLDHHACRVE